MYFCDTVSLLAINLTKVMISRSAQSIVRSQNSKVNDIDGKRK